MTLIRFSCSNDIALNNHMLFNHQNIRNINLRAIHDSPFFSQSIVLLSGHSTNARIIRYIRKHNVLTPIYIISNSRYYYKEINGVIPIKELTYEYLKQTLNLFPQSNIWNYVFQLDQKSRAKLSISNHLPA